MRQQTVWFIVRRDRVVRSRKGRRVFTGELGMPYILFWSCSWGRSGAWAEYKKNTHNPERIAAERARGQLYAVKVVLDVPGESSRRRGVWGSRAPIAH